MHRSHARSHRLDARGTAPALVLLAVALLVTITGCQGGLLTGSDDPPRLDIPEADLRVLFVGNSYTYVNNLPAVVGALAAGAGRSLAWGLVAYPNYSLEDHWNAGLEEDIRSARPDVVVLQQGPSTLPLNREHLVSWTRTISEVVREVGGEPALLMVWPGENRAEYFGAAHRSYATAAVAVGGLFIPAGQSWVEAWELDDSLEFYGPDRLHPSYLGTLAAAHATAAVLLDIAPADLPALPDGVDPATLEVLRQALEASLGLGTAGASAGGTAGD